MNRTLSPSGGRPAAQSSGADVINLGDRLRKHTPASPRIDYKAGEVIEVGEDICFVSSGYVSVVTTVQTVDGPQPLTLYRVTKGGVLNAGLLPEGRVVDDVVYTRPKEEATLQYLASTSVRIVRAPVEKIGRAPASQLVDILWKIILALIAVIGDLIKQASYHRGRTMRLEAALKNTEEEYQTQLRAHQAHWQRLQNHWESTAIAARATALIAENKDTELEAKYARECRDHEKTKEELAVAGRLVNFLRGAQARKSSVQIEAVTTTHAALEEAVAPSKKALRDSTLIGIPTEDRDAVEELRAQVTTQRT